MSEVIMLITDIANWLADMPNQVLPIYPMQFPADVINCIAVFPTGGGVGGNIGVSSGHFTNGSGNAGALDYPGVQVQVRYTDPHNAFAIAEDIRKWLDFNPPTGYVALATNRSIPDDLTVTSDLEMVGGPAYRFSVDFGLVKVRT
jgi:hypothetical protein